MVSFLTQSEGVFIQFPSVHKLGTNLFARNESCFSVMIVKIDDRFYVFQHRDPRSCLELSIICRDLIGLSMLRSDTGMTLAQK
jgi:hypothetical protein